jgi:hypothetical protein
MASALLIAVSESQNHRCAYCGIQTILSGIDSRFRRKKKGRPLWQRQRRATLDHILPKSQGGDRSRLNLVMACQWCNQWRACKPALEAFARLLDKVRKGSHPHFGKWGHLR